MWRRGRPVKSPRVVASLHPDDFRRLARVAHEEAVPTAEIVRRAVSAYLGSVRRAAKDASP